MRSIASELALGIIAERLAGRIWPETMNHDDDKILPEKKGL